jgi:hypothetical protein
VFSILSHLDTRELSRISGFCFRSLTIGTIFIFVLVPIFSGAAFLPFGGGVTLCPGRRFARNEVKCLVAFLLTEFEFAFVGAPVHPGHDGARAGLGIFPPKGDVAVSVRKIVR